MGRKQHETRRQKSSLPAGKRIALYVAGSGIWLSGGLWLIFHNFLAQQGEFGATPHPLEPWLLRVHGAFAFGIIWLFGLMWGIHVTKFWATGRSRWSGSFMTGVLCWMMVTGYLLYYVGDDKARSVVAILHWSCGLGIPALFLWHRLGAFRRKTVLPRATPINRPAHQKLPEAEAIHAFRQELS